MKKLLYAAAALLLGISSCSKEADDLPADNPGQDIKVNFSVALPGGSDIVYPSKTRDTHTATEYEISNIVLYEFSVSDGNQPTTLFDKHSFSKADGSIVSQSAGVYTMTFTIPYKYYKEKRKFIFVANDALADAGLKTTEDDGTGTSFTEFNKALATIVVKDNDKASVLSPQAGIAMSGVGMVNSSDIITLTSAFNCEVTLKRIVARVDVVNKTPNMVITDIKLHKAASKAHIMPQSGSFAAPTGSTDVEMQYNENTENGNSGTPGLGSSYEEQNNNGGGLKKVFYMYERENKEDNHSSVEISYTLNENVKGSVIVPFRKRDESQEWVNIERNHLYKIILGNGKPVVTSPVEISFTDEDWNVVDVDNDVDVEQDKMNAALMVNKFTQYNVASANLSAKTATFETSLRLPTDVSSFFSFADLAKNELAGVGAPALFTVGNQKYRLPSIGEMNLLFPYASIYFNTSPVKSGEYNETLYLEQNFDGSQNYEGKKITGVSIVKKADSPKSDGTYIVYGNRLRGSAEHAAYRWEVAEQSGVKYISIKIKALKQFDGVTKIEEIAKEDYWRGGFIEYQFPITGHISSGTSITGANISNYMWGISRNPFCYISIYNVSGAHSGGSSDWKCPIRLVKADAGDEAAYNEWKAHLNQVKQSMTNVAVGDFILKDGMVVKPTHFDTHPEDRANAVAIVASINKNRMSEGIKDAIRASQFGDTHHGLALALKNLNNGNPIQWKTENTNSLPVAQYPYITTPKLAYDNYKGYEATKHIYTLSDWRTKHPVFKEIESYKSKVPVPPTTSEWYLPSPGEWVDMIEGLSGKTINNDWKTGTGGISTKMTDTSGNNIIGTTLVDKINNDYLSKAGSGYYDNFITNYYETSYEYSEQSSSILYFGNASSMFFNNGSKTGNFYGRVILAF